MDTGDILGVYRSVVVREDGPLFVEVRRLLAARCSVKGISEWHDDEDMAGGRAENATYVLWNECPGARIVHDCMDAFVPQCRSTEPTDCPDSEQVSDPA
ncbi:hypothetical protein [Amycolatopsis minnesotensis]|uniref:Uncharacterized protein n=1 Tax=Amycolatopsis minnesotensis TaxID=337894 RepID=A0ABN2Q334_9PSEU